MKSSLLLAVSGAFLALASPVAIEKREYEIEVVTTWTTVYVTEGVSTTMLGPGTHILPTLTSKSTTSTSPPPRPTTSSSVPVPTPSKQVQPAIEAPEIEHTTSTTPAPPPPSTTPTTTEVQESTSNTQTQSSIATPSDFASTAVYQHNIHRANHSAPSVSYSDTHAGYAADVAASCVFAHNLTPGGGGYGQNIAMWASSDAESLGENDALAQAITNMWYNGEVTQFPSSDYGVSTPDMSNFEGWGHFSQVVWVNSQQVGCATQYCAPGTMYPDMGAWFSVCNYYPAGNVDGEYGQNVLRPLGEATVTV